MEPPLLERISWTQQKRTGVDAPASTAMMARAGAYLGGAGAGLTFIVMLLPHGGTIDELALASAALAAALTVALLVVVYDRLPLWAFHVLAVGGSVDATVAIDAWGVGSSYGPLPYLWVTIFVFYFFPLRAALAQGLVMAALYAALLATEDLPASPVAGWFATVGTLVVAGVLIAAVRDRIAGLIANLTDAARSDPLTALLNRRGFQDIFDVELERARRSESGLSLIVGDLDRFKQVNDTLGHGAGDEVLRRVAKCVLSAKRSFDSAARVGGEEFGVLAPDCDEHGAYILAERMRTDIQEVFAATPVPLTVSFGIVTFPLHGQTAEALLQAADQALYAAKRLGRNRSVISSAEVPGILARAPRGHESGHVELATLLNLAEALDVRDSGSTTHCHRVARFAELIARELGLPPTSVERIRLAGILHDVGRVGVPDDLLSKRGPLNDDEWDWVRAHPETGARMLETTDFEDIGKWILAHHERPDGTGYPKGRAGRQVPLEASILSVADAYEAMTADRAYREALDADEAAQQLRQGAGSQFDERVVEAILRVV